MTLDVDALVKRIQELADLVDPILKISDPQQPKLRREYQIQYSQAHLLVKTHLPEREEEFSGLYYNPDSAWGKSHSGISTYLKLPRERELFEADLEQQRGILLAIPEIIELCSLEVAALVTADLVEGELKEADILLEHGFVRAAGAVAGVALEAHLKLLHKQSGHTYTDKDSIVPLATRLRLNGIITLGDEKKCIAMADARNNCDHKNKRVPTEDEVEELINDVDRFTKRAQYI